MSNPGRSQQPGTGGVLQLTKQESRTFCCHPLKCRCCGHYFPLRIVLALMLHLALQNNFTTRVTLNVAIVEMVEPDVKESKGPVACPEFGTPNQTQTGDKFPWPRETKSLVLYAFYIGYTITQVPGGWLADKFGARPVIISSVIVTTAATALFPLATQWWGYIAAVLLRFLVGLSHGFVMPALSSMVSTWFPRHERPKWGGIAYAGTNLGTIMGTMITGALIHAYDWWPVAFYFWAAYSGVYLLMVLFFVYSFPDTHPYITVDEILYIKSKTLAGDISETSSMMGRPLHTPWKGILLNGPYWANIAAQFGHNYIYLSLITYLPTYLREILQFNVEDDGYFSALPFVALWITSLILSGTAQFFIRCTSERFFNTAFGAGSNIASSALILGAVYVGCNRELCIGLYVISMIIKAFYYVTLPVNINALSRNYGGIMFGLCNGVGSIAGIIGNFVIGAVTKEKQFHEWRLAFWICLAVTSVTTIIYALFSSNERQEFDYNEDEPRDYVINRT